LRRKSDLPRLPPVIPDTTIPSNQIPLAPADIPGSIIVKRFEVVGSTVFSQAELEKVLKP
jgi:hypothetical protein